MFMGSGYQVSAKKEVDTASCGASVVRENASVEEWYFVKMNVSET
jgi:hypothetical protein